MAVLSFWLCAKASTLSFGASIGTAPAHGISEVWILKLALLRSLIETSGECKFQTSHSADPIRWGVQGDMGREEALVLAFLGGEK